VIPPHHPFGIEENRRNLEVAIDCVYRQGMNPAPLRRRRALRLELLLRHERRQQHVF
jgi:hypothetical protein